MMYEIKDKEVEPYFDFNDALAAFHNLFNYESKDDRTIAILGGTFLEMVLEHILLAYLPSNEKEVNKLFEFNNPLGNFSNKIAMIYCLGFDTILKSDLTFIRKIRNEFAYDLYASFENEKISNWCNELRWHKESLMSEAPSEASARDLFQVGVNTLISHLHGVISIARTEKREVKFR